jgi:hypothetical protein
MFHNLYPLRLWLIEVAYKQASHIFLETLYLVKKLVRLMQAVKLERNVLLIYCSRVKAASGLRHQAGQP